MRAGSIWLAIGFSAFDLDSVRRSFALRSCRVAEATANDHLLSSLSTTIKVTPHGARRHSSDESTRGDVALIGYCTTRQRPIRSALLLSADEENLKHCLFCPSFRSLVYQLLKPALIVG
eukprot:5408873-Pleurochrysis_carterae.AAC.1